jgi:hypothetical protein
MRVESFTVGSYVHIVKRGARGLDITGDESDRWRFLQILFYMNDKHYDENWMRTVGFDDSPTTVIKYDPFARPENWPARKPLVKILCYTLMSNHLHLLVQEIETGGVSKFMQKLGMSMSKHFNEKYKSKGSIFQGGYRGRTVGDDKYLRYVAAYIMVKNTFEMYPDGGLAGATKDFDKAWQWAIRYDFSSLADYCGTRKSAIIDKDILGEIFEGTKGLKEFRSFARDVILGGRWKGDTNEEYRNLALE